MHPSRCGYIFSSVRVLFLVQYLQAAILRQHICQWKENNGHLLLFDLHPTARELVPGAFALACLIIHFAL